MKYRHIHEDADIKIGSYTTHPQTVKERGKERQTDRQTGKQTGRQTDRV